MAEISVRFSSKRNGYDRDEVDQFVKDVETMLQEKAAALANLQQEVVDLEAKLHKITGDDTSVEEKVELYDKLMKKMNGDYTNLLAPAIAKAKKLEEKAEQEYATRIDQARFCAEGIYKETADRIAAIVDSRMEQNMDRMYELMDRFIYSRTLPGRVETFMSYCNTITKKIARGVYNVSLVPQKVKTVATEKVKETVNSCRESIVAFKESD